MAPLATMAISALGRTRAERESVPGAIRSTAWRRMTAMWPVAVILRLVSVARLPRPRGRSVMMATCVRRGIAVTVWGRVLALNLYHAPRSRSATSRAPATPRPVFVTIHRHQVQPAATMRTPAPVAKAAAVTPAPAAPVAIPSAARRHRGNVCFRAATLTRAASRPIVPITQTAMIAASARGWMCAALECARVPPHASTRVVPGPTLLA